MSSPQEGNKAIARRAAEEFWNKGNLNAVDELVHPDYVGHMPGQEIRGVEGFRRSIEGFRSAFPDVHFHVESQVAEGDEVVTHVEMQATHHGELKGIRATGKPVAVHGMSRVRVADGKVIEEWVQWDESGLMQQLGEVAEKRLSTPD